MFGDVGHGTLLLLYALYLIYNERKLGLKKLLIICLALIVNDLLLALDSIRFKLIFWMHSILRNL